MEQEVGERLWPMPPELPRFAFETALRSVADVQADNDRALLQRRLTGARRPDERVLQKPSGIAVSEGRVCVTDSVRRSIVVFNVPVQGVVSADGRLHVLDAGNFRVQTFDPDGRFLRSFGNVGTGLGQFARPRGQIGQARESLAMPCARVDRVTGRSA